MSKNENKKNETPKESKEKDKNNTDLGLLEEDDEFEEFPAEGEDIIDPLGRSKLPHVFPSVRTFQIIKKNFA